MKSVHLVISDLFLPQDFAGEVCSGLALPFLEKLLARGSRSVKCVDSLEVHLCDLFAVPSLASASAAFDGLAPGFYLRADPVHARLQREQVVPLPSVGVSAIEAEQFCEALNGYFADEQLSFFAPHPERWYVKVQSLPDILTTPLSQAAGRDMRASLPTGADARRWGRLFNEAQMLLFSHPLNEARKARGELPVNGVWFWGCDLAVPPETCTHDKVSSDDALGRVFADATGMAFASWQTEWRAHEGLLIWQGLRSALQRGDLLAWREALQAFETGYAKPLWLALKSGRIDALRIDVFCSDTLLQLELGRGDAWKFWRRTRRLGQYSERAK